MKTKLTTPLLASIGALALMLTLFLSFYFSTSAYRLDETGIVLPSDMTELPAVSPEPSTDDLQPALQGVEITADNVQDIIASLIRPSNYSFSVQNTLYYGPNSATFERRQYIKNGACRTDELSSTGAVVRSAIRYEDKTYLWENGDTRYTLVQSGTFTEDAAAMLPTYETVISLPREQILEAGLTNIDYKPCIYVKTTEADFSVTYYISTISGLLTQMELLQGETLIRRCTLSSVMTNAPADSFFVLPGGTSVFEVKGT